MSELILHVGMGKSASTSIQKNLLLNSGIPVISRHMRDRDSDLDLEAMWWRGLCSTKDEQIEKAKEVLNREFINKYSKVVLSDEVISGSPNLLFNIVNNLKDICSLKLLLVTRKQDDFLASFYNHSMRSRVLAFGIPRLNSDAISYFIYNGRYTQWVEQLIKGSNYGDKNIIECINYYKVYTFNYIFISIVTTLN